MKPANHKPTKRRNIQRWMYARLRRIDRDVAMGRATALQRDRAHQLACAIQIMISKPQPPTT